MKKKTINALLAKKFDDFAASITDPVVQGLVQQHTIITGGCVTSMLLKEEVNDYDLYFTNRETVLAVARYYLTLFNETNKTNGYIEEGEDGRVKIIFKSNGVAREDGREDLAELQEEYVAADNEALEAAPKPRYRPVFLSSNAITLSQQIQIVIRFYGEPEAIHDNYDFVHCTNYWTSKDRKVVLRQEALEAILAKELVYIGSKYPLASIIRTRKFIRRGWQINAGQYLKMAFQCSSLDLTNIQVLEDQLVGVDSAYFGILIDALKAGEEAQKKEGKEQTISYGYLSTIIDKIF